MTKSIPTSCSMTSRPSIPSDPSSIRKFLLGSPVVAPADWTPGSARTLSRRERKNSLHSAGSEYLLRGSVTRIVSRSLASRPYQDEATKYCSVRPQIFADHVGDLPPYEKDRSTVG